MMSKTPTYISSFDVFDTCILRSVLVPSDVFFLLHEKINKKSSDFNLDPEEFVWARCQAERLARSKTSEEEITLEEIWREYSKILNKNFHPQWIIDELELEESLFLQNNELHHLVKECRANGNKIIFTSDTYFPESFLRKILTKHDFFKAGDVIYASGNYALTKHSGNLYKKIIEIEKNDNITHYGDNYYSDVTQARKAGIHAIFKPKNKISELEKICRNIFSIESTTAVKWSAAVKKCGTTYNPSKSGASGAIATRFVIPVLFTYVSWVLNEAQRQGIKKLYFLSRDCELAYYIARELSTEYGMIDCRYLQVSRQALLLPSVENISRSELSWVKRDFEEHTIERIAAKIEMPVASIKSIFNSNPMSVHRYLMPEDWEMFWKLIESDLFKKELNTTINTRRTLANAYFKQEGLFDDCPIAIVDFGWLMSCQKALNKILKIGGRSECLSGFYLDHANERLFGKEVGQVTTLFHPKPDDNTEIKVESTPHQYATLIEHILGVADHPSVNSYETTKNGITIPKYVSNISEMDVTSAQELQQIATCFANENKSITRELGSGCVASEIISKLLNEFFERPTKSIIQGMANIQFTNDQNGIGCQKTVRKITLLDLLLEVLPFKNKSEKYFFTKRRIWFKADLINSNWLIRTAWQIGAKVKKQANIYFK